MPQGVVKKLKDVYSQKNVYFFKCSTKHIKYNIKILTEERWERVVYARSYRVVGPKS